MFAFNPTAEFFFLFFCLNIVTLLGEKLTSTLAKDIETNEKELAAWMDKHSAIYRELETTYNEMSGY